MSQLKTLLILGVATVLNARTTDHPINDDIVKEIKNKTKAWTPYEPGENPLLNYTHPMLHQILGTNLKPPLGTLMPKSENANIPKEFDPRV